MAEGFVTAGAGTVFLGVERSLTGQVWRDRLDDTARAQALAMVQDWALPDLVARILAGRGVMAHEAQLFLEPRMRDLMSDPLGLRDMDRVVERLVRAVQSRETVGIFGDYDVDGACSTALLAEGLSATGLVCRTHIPDRLTEGYGPNTEALQGLIAQGAGLIVTVDCGVTSHEVITTIAGSGTDVLVLDHHQAPEILPPAYGVVDPNRMDDLSGLGHLCAAGVVFLTLVALYRALRADGFWTPQRPEPDLRSLLDLVALATVADVVPLRGLNRAFVRQGLQIMRQRQRNGLRALIDAVRLSGPVEAWHLGYLLGPRINAGGRIGDAGLGVRLLLTQDTAEAERIALQLDALNRDRQMIEASMVDEGEAAALKQVGIHEDLGAVIVTSGLSWHPGVVGLVAARLKERFARPAFALALDEAGLATGSGRSITGVDLGRVVRKAVEDGLLLRGGGHAMAAGVTLRQEQIEAFTTYLEQELGPAVSKARADQGLWIDAAVTAAGATVPVLHAIEQVGPYGSAYPDPCFVLPAHRLTQVSEVQGGHLRLVLRAGDGSTIKGMAFRVAGKPLGQALLDQRNQTIHVAGRLSIDRYGGGEKAQIQVSDIAKPV